MSDEPGQEQPGADADAMPEQFAPLGLVAVAPESVLFHYAQLWNRSEVCFIGDSHTLICGADRAYPGCDLDARPGRTTREAVKILEDGFLLPRHLVIVFELATNDVIDEAGQIEYLKRLGEISGDRQLVLVNTWRTDPPNTHHRVNAALAEFAATVADRAQLVDWAAAVDAMGPEALGFNPDLVHFSFDAYEERIRLVSAALDEARRRAGVQTV